MRLRLLRAVLCTSAALLALVITGAAQEQTSADAAKERHREGHSRLGEAWDEGPRERPARRTST